jgi:hypothetical protein
MTEGAVWLGPFSPFFTFLSFPIKLSTTQFTGLPLHFLVVGYALKPLLLLLGRESPSESLALVSLSLTPIHLRHKWTTTFSNTSDTRYRPTEIDCA